MSTRKDDPFEPRLGKIRQRKTAATRLVRRTLNAAGPEPGSPVRKPAQAPQGSRWAARGRSAGAIAAGRAVRGQRRVVIKARITRIGRTGIAPLRTHLLYLKRDGVTRDGTAGSLYGRDSDEADGRAFAATCEQDRHQFRFIIAPEDGEQLHDLKPFVRDLMAEMEHDLGTKLDWVAADHFNTGHPHSHVVVRGRNEAGDDLVIARDYISHGLRARAAALLTLELGPKTDIALATDWKRQVTQDRFTALDGWISARAKADRIDRASLQPGAVTDVLAHTRADLAVQRLRQLEIRGLARADGASRWVLEANWDQTLRRLGDRGDILKTIHRALAAHGMSHRAGDVDIAAAPPDRPITGELLARGLHDEHRDRHYAILDGEDGRIHYREMLPERIDPRTQPGMVVTLLRDRRARQTRLQVRSTLPLDAQISAVGPTWLDAGSLAQTRQREADASMAAAADGKNPADHAVAESHHVRTDRTSAVEALPSAFAARVRQARQQRLLWLEEQGVLARQDAPARLTPGVLKMLQQRMLEDAAHRLSAETGQVVSIAAPASALQGRYIRRLDLADGAHAVIDQGHGLTLAPWSAALERLQGQKVQGILRAGRFQWLPDREIGLGIG